MPGCLSQDGKNVGLCFHLKGDMVFYIDGAAEALDPLTLWTPQFFCPDLLS